MRYFNIHISDIIAALSTSLLYTLGAYSFATLIFSGPLSSYLPHGFNLILISNIVGCLFASRFSSFPVVASLIQPSDLAIFVLIAMGLTANILGSSEHFHPIYTVYAALVLITITVGLFLWVMGKFKIGNIIRFIPFPIVVAFLAASGWILFDFSIKLILGKSLKEFQPQLVNTHAILQFLLSLSIVISIIILQKWYSRVLVEPLLYFMSFILFYTVVFFLDVPIETLKNSGWYIETLKTSSFSNPFLMLSPEKIQWKAFLDLNIIGNIFAILIISPLFLLLTINGIERETKHEFNYDHELKYTGISNLVLSLLGGGTVASHSLSGTLRNYQLGAKSRWVGVFMALFFSIALLFGTIFLQVVPLFIVASLPLMTGINLMRNWLIYTRKKLILLDYILLWVIFIAIVLYGFLIGILFGFVASLMLFDYRYTRINIIRNEVTGLQLYSNNERGMAAISLLRNMRGGIKIIILQGYLFFGNINALIENLIRTIDSLQSNLFFIVLDFRNVQGVDPSATESFFRLYTHAKNQNIRLVFTHLPDTIFQNILNFLKITAQDEYCKRFNTLDYGIEWCENYLLLQKSPNWDVYLKGQLSLVFPNESELKIFMRYLEPLKVEQDSIVFVQDEILTKLYFLDAGILEMNHTDMLGNKTRVKTIYPGVFVGESSFYLGMKQIVSCRAKITSSLYSLSFDNLITLEKEHPTLATLFHRYIVCQTLNRLAHTHKTILSLI